MKNVADVYSLSPTQEGILFHCIADGSKSVFFEQYSAKLSEHLDQARFEEAWTTVIHRHPALRTAFVWDGVDEPLQIVREAVALPWTQLDWSDLDDGAQNKALDQLLVEDRQTGFDLANAPLLRFHLINLGPDQWHFLWSFHHLVSDGWSTAAILAEVREVYADMLEGDAPDEVAVPAYRDYIAWSQHRDHAEDMAWWQGIVSDVRETTSIGRPVPDRRKGIKERHVSRLDAAAAKRLSDFARESRVTASSVFQTAWALLLSRYANADDVVFGVTVSGRPEELKGVERMVGPFLNTLPMRVRLESDPSVANLLQSVQADSVKMRAHQSAPLVEVQRASGLSGGQALFESILVFENYPAGDPPEILAFSEVDYREESNYPLAILVAPHLDFEIQLVFDPEFLSLNEVRQISDRFQRILLWMLDHPGEAVSSFELLNPDEIALLLEHSPLDAPTSFLPDQVGEAAQRSPDSLAIVAPDGQLTYDELIQRADGIAAQLIRAGAVAGDRVLLVMERSTDLISGMLGILRAGCAYVPADPEYPVERTNLVAEDAGAKWIVSSRSNDNGSFAAGGMIVVNVEDADSADDFSPVPVGSDSLAYLIYTSGSTGRPKGVEITHGNLAASNAARLQFYDEPPRSFLLMSSFAFDSSVAGIFWTLASGGTLVIPPRRIEQDLHALGALIASHQISHTLILPSIYRLAISEIAPDQLRSLDCVIVAGEACSPEVVVEHFRRLPQARLFNEYGPTEATVWSSAAELSPNDSEKVSIGSSIPGASMFIADRHGRLLPEGVPGEICIAGPGVSRGYRDRPELTARAFRSGRYLQESETRYYATGDLGRRLPGGRFEFLGRVDDQIKIRGFRVEPGEIEAALVDASGAREAVVLARSVSDGGARQLIAWLAGGTWEDVDVRDRLSGRFPAYMVPSLIVRVDEIPRLPNGKVDRSALLIPEVERPRSRPAGEVRSEAEQQLLEIWQAVLRQEEISVDDNFFEIGGDSILSIQIVSRVRQAGLQIEPNALFQAPTIAELALVVGTGVTTVSEESIEGPVALSPIQQWFVEAQRSIPDRWNLAWSITRADASLDAVGSALVKLINRHDALRLRFDRSQVEASARIGPKVTEAVSVELRESNLEADLAHLHARINPTTGPTIAAGTLLRGDHSAVVLVAHHLVTDVVSGITLTEEMNLLLDGAELAQPSALWRAAVDANVKTDRTQELAYWRDQLSGTEIIATTGSGTEAEALSLVTTLEAEETQDLLTGVHEAYGTRSVDLIHSALGTTLCEMMGTESVTIGMEQHGRDGLPGVDLTRSVGWFTSFFPFKLEAKPDPGDQIKSTKEAFRNLPDQGAGFGALRYSPIDDHSDLKAWAPTVLFNYLGSTDTSQLDEVIVKDARAPDCRLAIPLQIDAGVKAGQFVVRWRFDPGTIPEAGVSRIADRFNEELRHLIGHCKNQTTGEYTPSDFPDAGLDQSALDSFLDKLG